MKFRYKILLGFLYGLFICGATQAQNTYLSDQREPPKDTLLFKFAPGKRMFWRDYEGNNESIQIMSQLIRKNKPSIESGDLKIRIFGFCSSYDSIKENLAAAKNRSNQLKSYFIIHEGLKEEHFLTLNSTHRWRGLKDVIAVVCLYEKKNFETSVSPENQQETIDNVEPAVSKEESLPSEATTANANHSPQSTPSPTQKTDKEVFI